MSTAPCGGTTACFERRERTVKIAVLGSTGMAGHVVAAYLEERGHQVYRTSRSEKDGPRSRGIDVCDFSALGACWIRSPRRRW